MNGTNKKKKIIDEYEEGEEDKHVKQNKNKNRVNDASNAEENEEDGCDDNFKTAAVKFIKIDNLLADKRKEKREITSQINEDIKTITKQKKKLESFLVEYLEKIKKTQVKIDDDDALEKKEKIRRKPINADMIKSVFQDEMTKKKILDPKRGALYAEEIIKIIDETRTISKENVICRKTSRQKKTAAKK
jgi:hypothetical protein